MSRLSARGAKGYVVFILGTGTNTAYLENGEAINVESGGFDKLFRTEIDLEVDAATNNPGKQVFGMRLKDHSERQ